MMNLDPVPPIPAMNTAAVNFLDLLADPKAARQMMDDLASAHAKASAAHAEAKKLQVEVFEQQKRHGQDVNTFEQNRKAHSAFLADAGTKLDKRVAEVEAREKKLREDQAALDERQAQHDADTRSLHAKMAAHQSAVKDHDRAARLLEEKQQRQDRWDEWMAQRPE